MRRPVLVLGAGGHAAVVADALLAADTEILGFTDREAGLHGTHVCGFPVLGDDGVLSQHARETVLLANGIGTTGTAGEHARRTLQERLGHDGWEFVTVRHPTAVVSRFAIIDAGVQLLAGCVVQVGAKVGVGAIVNTSAVIEHGATIGAWTHVAPGAIVCGDVSVGVGCLIGAGAVLRQGLVVGDACVIGAGAVVIRDVPAGSVLVGVPARHLSARPTSAST
jgi:sugar O-acyltransferase (sialic acid O-acetyltransferase NeuD family)